MIPPVPEPLDPPPAETPEEATERRDRRHRPWLHLPVSRALILAVSIVVILLAVLAPVGYNTLRGNQNASTASAQQQEIAQLKDILAYLTGSKQSQAQAAGNKWIVKQIRDICLAFQTRPVGGPPCKLEQLPPLLQQYVNTPDAPPAPPGAPLTLPPIPPTTRAP